MCGRVDGNDPKKVIICHSTGHYNMINSRSVFLVLCGNTCHDGVDLCPFKIAKCHVHAAKCHGLLRHLYDGISARGIVTEKNIGKCRKNHHRHRNEDDKYSNQDF